MKPCISQATTLSTPFEVDIPAYAMAGWSAVELWLTKLETYLQNHPLVEAKTLLVDNQLHPVAAAGQGGLLLSQGIERQTHWDLFRSRLELLAELEVPTMIIAADFVTDLVPEDYGRAVESLVEAAGLVQDLGIRLALEFQKGSKFCTSLDTALALIAQTGSSQLGVCLDLFHYYTGPSKFEDLGFLSTENLAWVQACDLAGVPREMAGDADRILPGEGDFQIEPIFDHLAAIGYEGYVSLEVLNPQLWGISAERVADAGRHSLERLLRPRSKSQSQPSRGVS